MVKKEITFNRQQLLFYVLVLFVVLFDATIKHLVMTNASAHVPIVSFLSLTQVYNYGASFGLASQYGSTANSILFVFAILISIGTCYLVFTKHQITHAAHVPLGLIIGGALGNAIDRIQYGAVFDFIAVHYRDWYFPAFNIADSAITIGAILYIWKNLKSI